MGEPVSALVVIAKFHSRDGSAVALEEILNEPRESVRGEPCSTLDAPHNGTATVNISADCYEKVDAYEADMAISALASRGPCLAYHLVADVEVTTRQTSREGGGMGAS
jgi:hypothetical protein